MAPSRDDVETRLRFFLEDLRQGGVDLAEQAATPSFINQHVEDVTTTGQILAFLFLGPVIVVSLQLIVVLNELMTEIIGTQSLGASQDPIFAWLITAITGGAFLMAAWAWFQFVRTGAFGLFTWADLD